MTVGERVRAPELSRLPLLFQERFRSRAAVEKNGATLVGTGTTFSDGLVLNGSGNLLYTVSGAKILRAALTIKIVFTLGFSGDDGVLHYFIDAATSTPAARFAITKDASNNIVVTAGNTVVLTAAYATWSAQLVAGRNTLIISTTTGATTAWLNGTSIGTSATAWSFAVSTLFAIGASIANANRYTGTIHEVAIYGNVCTSVDEPYLRQGNLIESIDFSKALAYLPGVTSYQRDSDSLFVTEVGGKGTVKEALMGSDGSTAAQFPGLLTPRGFSFDGGDQINLGDSDQFSFTTGSADKPFSVSALIIPSKFGVGVVMPIISKMDVDGVLYEWIFSVSPLSRSLSFLCYDGSARKGRSSSNNSIDYLPTVVIGTYGGSGTPLTGVKLYKNGVAFDSANSTSGTYVCMKNTAAACRVGSDNNASRLFRGVIILPVIWDFELSPLQAKALTARMLRLARAA